jgi:hypothetical protein
MVTDTEPPLAPPPSTALLATATAASDAPKALLLAPPPVNSFLLATATAASDVPKAPCASSQSTALFQADYTAASDASQSSFRLLSLKALVSQDRHRCQRRSCALFLRLLHQPFQDSYCCQRRSLKFSSALLPLALLATATAASDAP